MYWINGTPADQISVADRSFNYGDGGFTTIKTRHGVVEHWPLHVQRMQACLNRLQIPQPDWELVRQWVDKAVLTDPQAGIKVLISRGEGGRGYSPSGHFSPNVVLSSFPYPVHYPRWQQEGLELGVANARLGINPLLAGHKHNNRLEQVIIKADIEQQGFADGIVLDIRDRVIETTVANLFWVKGDTLYTPDLQSSGVAGVIRRLILEQCESDEQKVSIGDFNLTQLFGADEVFLCNSLLGVAPIRKIGDKSFPIGIITREFQQRINSD